MTSITVATGICDAFLCLRVEEALSSWVEEAKGTFQSACHLGVADAGLHTRLRHSAVWRLINLEPIYGRSSWWQRRWARTKIERPPHVRKQQEGQGKSYPLGSDPAFQSGRRWDVFVCFSDHVGYRVTTDAWALRRSGAFGSSAKRMVPLAGRCSVEWKQDAQRRI